MKGIKKDVQRYVARCVTYQKKKNHGQTRVPLVVTSMPDKPLISRYSLPRIIVMDQGAIFTGEVL